MPHESHQREGVMAPTQLAAAAVYAEALLDQIKDDAHAQDIARELESLVGLLDANPGAEELLTAALLSVRERCELILRIFHGRVSELMEAFMAVLARRDRLKLFRPAARQFQKLLDRRQGKVEVTLTTAIELNADQRRGAVEALRKALGAEPVLTTRVDPDLLGGATVRTGDRVYDASVAAQLKRLSQNLSRRITSLAEQQP